MYTSIMVDDQISPDLELLSQVRLELLVDVIYDGATTVLLVDLVAIASRADNHESQPHVALLQVYCTPRK